MWRSRGTSAAKNKLWLRLIRNDQLVLSVLALTFGIGGAYSAIAFRLAIDAIQIVSYGAPSEEVYSTAIKLSWWHLLLAPTLGGLAVGIFIHFCMAERRPLGVADVMESTALRGGYIRLRDGISAAVVSATSIGVGASVGREGPVVHLAATISSYLSTRLKLDRSMNLTLLGCGVASAVAASFNAPIAGAFFALEVVVGHYGLGAFAPVVISSVTGTIIARVHLGDFPAFTVPGLELTSYSELPLFILLGVVCAAIAIFYMSTIIGIGRALAKSPIPRILLPACGGLSVGMMALIFPQVIGVGYETTNLALSGGFGASIFLLVALVLAKTIASSVSLGCGFGGGVFSPSLCIGALSGAAFGLVIAILLPGLNVDPNAYSVVGMGAVAGAVLGAPISTFLIIFELTGDFGLTVAVLLSTAVSTLVVKQSVGHSMFTWQLKTRGVDISNAGEHAICQSIPVRQLVTKDFKKFAEETTKSALAEEILSDSKREYYLVDENGILTGFLTFSDAISKVLDPNPNVFLTAKDLSKEPISVLDLNDTLDKALKFFEFGDFSSLPVVETHSTMKLVGVVRHRDAILAYNQELIRLRRHEHGET